jgi:uncharacterized protein
LKKKYDVIIVGSGPAGLGICFKLMNSNKKLSILMIDKNKYSLGGLKNDGKLNWWNHKIGFTKEHWNSDNANKYMQEAEKYLKPNYLPIGNLDNYIERAKKYDSELLIAQQSHIGTDKSLEYIDNLINQVKSKGIEILLEREMVDLDYDNKCIIMENGEKMEFDNLAFAVGRYGATFMQRIMNKVGINYLDNIVDIGVRLEMREENYTVTEKYYDPKFILGHSGDIRTFCTNSRCAFVTKEKYKDFNSVNGHALSNDKKPNGLVNFAMLKTIKLTEPIASGNEYAKIVGKMAMAVGGGEPIMQRMEDFMAGKRSKRSSINNEFYGFSPTLNICTPGNVALAMPSVIYESIKRGIETLGLIVPYMMHPGVLIYYPEIKKYMNKPNFINDNFKMKDFIWGAGDGCGNARGITGSFCAGLRVGDGLLNEL